MGIYYNPTQKQWVTNWEKVDYTDEELRSDRSEGYSQRYLMQHPCDVRNIWGHCVADERWGTRWIPDNGAIYANQLGRENQAQLEKNKKLNTAYSQTLAAANSTKGGDYVQQRNIIKNIKEVDETLKEDLEEQFKTFYRTEKLQTWDTNLGAKPLYGDFDPKYYKQTYPEVAEQWKAAVANDDLDITERYGENGYYLQHYTNQGRPAGYRGNAPEVAEQSRVYVEKKPTDQDIQAVRELQLGVDANTQTQRLLNIPKIIVTGKQIGRAHV